MYASTYLYTDTLSLNWVPKSAGRDSLTSLEYLREDFPDSYFLLRFFLAVTYLCPWPALLWKHFEAITPMLPERSEDAPPGAVRQGTLPWHAAVVN